MEGRARVSWKSQPRIILIIFVLSRERQDPAELQASEGSLGSQGTMGQRGHREGPGSKGRRYVCWLAPSIPCQGMGTGMGTGKVCHQLGTTACATTSPQAG